MLQQHKRVLGAAPDEVLGRDARNTNCSAHQAAASDKDAPARTCAKAAQPVHVCVHKTH